jgi:pyruvate ferredoxin oxidoreductase gamma subunit
VSPNALVVIDPTLVHQVDLFSGLAADGYVLINSSRTFEELGLATLFGRFRRDRLLTTPASEIAQRHTGRSIPNAALLGGFAAMTAEVSLDAVGMAIRDRFSGQPPVAERNVAAATEVYHYVLRVMATKVEKAMLGAQTD